VRNFTIWADFYDKEPKNLPLISFDTFSDLFEKKKTLGDLNEVQMYNFHFLQFSTISGANPPTSAFTTTTSYDNTFLFQKCTK
jgi:hypothetical protein